MNEIEQRARDFLAQKKIAVAGVSATREDAANANYRKFKQLGYTVYPLNPKISTFEGDVCYPNVSALPEPVDGIFVVTGPVNSQEIVRQSIDAGIKRVWMHCAFGTSPRFLKGLANRITSVSNEAIQMCEDRGVTVIPGGCPMQFHGGIGHKCMRRIFKWSGGYSKPKGTLLKA